MSQARQLIAILLLAAVSACGQIKTQSPKGLEAAKLILQGYADGEPMASEAITFPQIIRDLKEAHPQKAQILEEGFKDLQGANGDLASKANKLLKKLF